MAERQNKHPFHLKDEETGLHVFGYLEDICSVTTVRSSLTKKDSKCAREIFFHFHSSKHVTVVELPIALISRWIDELKVLFKPLGGVIAYHDNCHTLCSGTKETPPCPSKESCHGKHHWNLIPRRHITSTTINGSEVAISTCLDRTFVVLASDANESARSIKSTFFGPEPTLAPRPAPDPAPEPEETSVPKERPKRKCRHS
jgi:hypothetical protein